MVVLNAPKTESRSAAEKPAAESPTPPCAAVISTEGLPLLWELAATPDNIIFHSPDCELENMAYLQTSYRWPAVYGHGGTIRVRVPKSGTYYVGAVIYEGDTPMRLYGMPKVDTPPGTPSYEVAVDGRVLGRFSPRQNDHRERLYFVDAPVEFKGGEWLTVRTGPAGVHIVEDILLLRMRPPVRPRELAIRHVSADYMDRPQGAALRITWTTTWSARCTVTCNEGVIVEDAELANHRVLISDLKPGETCRYRITAMTPAGDMVDSGEMIFSFLPPAPAPTTLPLGRVELRVDNPHGFAVKDAPVTCGVPFAIGELGNAELCRLLDANGREIPSQRRVTGRWRDGSVRWILATFMADMEANQSATFTVEYGNTVNAAAWPAAVSCERNGDTLAVRNARLQVRFDAAQSGFPVGVLFDGREVPIHGLEAQVVDDQGKTWVSRAPAVSMVIEEAGPLRLVVKTGGHHRDAGGHAFFAYEARFIFYAGASWFEMRYAWGNDRPEQFSQFRKIEVRMPLREEKPTWRLGLDPGRNVTGSGDVLLQQLKDDLYRVEGVDIGDAASRHAEGWLQVRTGDSRTLIAVRDFRELYPRSLAVKGSAVEIGVSGAFPPDFYENAQQKQHIDLYFHLRGDAWKVRRGVRKWHDLLFHFRPSKANGDAARQAIDLFTRPLTAVCSPEYVCATRAFGRVDAASAAGQRTYEDHCEQAYDRYLRRRDEDHLHGQMNYGDMLGENLVSWLNNEYDIAHCALLHYARTGDRKWLELGRAAVKHDMDIDVCHYGPETGSQWAHALGHTGDYFDRDPYGIKRDIDDYGSGNLRKALCGSDHSWVGGMHDWYFLTGDPVALETLQRVADYFCGATWLNNFDWYAAREAGWHLVLLQTAHNTTGDPYYLNGSRIILERVLARQTPGPRGWHHQMTPSHCYCTPRHRGEASYMICILATGLELLYDATADERIAEAIVGGADQVMDEMWVEQAEAFRATSCPNTSWASPAQLMEMAPLYMSNVAQMLLFAHARTGRERYRDIAERSLRKTLSARGIGMAHMYWMPLALASLRAAASSHSPRKKPT